MFQLLGNLQWLIRITIAFGFAAFWGYWAYRWNEMGDFGPGKPTVIGVAILAGIAGLSGLIGLVRMVTWTAAVKLPERTKPRDDLSVATDFDPDEIMARYIAGRATSTSPTAAPARTEPDDLASQTQRPRFGRKKV